jgi:hypothetical protein
MQELSNQKPYHKPCKDCLIQPLTQYNCHYDGTKLQCTPIKRFFRMHLGYATVEISENNSFEIDKTPSFTERKD